jgi:hypothetical protein
MGILIVVFNCNSPMAYSKHGSSKFEVMLLACQGHFSMVAPSIVKWSIYKNLFNKYDAPASLPKSHEHKCQDALIGTPISVKKK